VKTQPPNLNRDDPVTVRVKGALTSGTYVGWSDKYNMALVNVDGQVLPRKLFATGAAARSGTLGGEVVHKHIVDTTEVVHKPTPAVDQSEMIHRTYIFRDGTRAHVYHPRQNVETPPAVTHDYRPVETPGV